MPSHHKMVQVFYENLECIKKHLTVVYSTIRHRNVVFHVFEREVFFCVVVFGDHVGLPRFDDYHDLLLNQMIKGDLAQLSESHFEGGGGWQWLALDIGCSQHNQIHKPLKASLFQSQLDHSDWFSLMSGYSPIH